MWTSSTSETLAIGLVDAMKRNIDVRQIQIAVGCNFVLGDVYPCSAQISTEYASTKVHSWHHWQVNRDAFCKKTGTNTSHSGKCDFDANGDG